MGTRTAEKYPDSVVRATGSRTRIAIIGAGASGLAAAWSLTRMGHDVTVLESESAPGGKCRTVETETSAGPIYAELGASLVGGPTYPRVQALATELGAEMEWWAPKYRFLDRNTGEIARPLRPGPLAVARLLKASFDERRIFSDASNGFAGVAPEFATPFSQWTVDRGIGDVAERFGPMSSFGYGYPDEVPAAYYLKFLNLRMLTRVTLPAGIWNAAHRDWMPGSERPRAKRFVEGYGGLMKRLADRVGNVLTGVEVLQVERSSGTVRIRFKRADEQEQLDADLLVVACPLDLASLRFLDATSTERELFAQVRWVPYGTAVCRATAPEGLEYGAAVLDGGKVVASEDGEPILAFRAPGNQTGEIYTVCTLSRPSSPPDRPLDQRLIDGAGRFGMEIHEVITGQEWRYFPHVGEEAFREGFHDEVERMQGENRTYYVGGLLSFETVENCVAYGQRIASEINQAVRS